MRLLGFSLLVHGFDGSQFGRTAGPRGTAAPDSADGRGVDGQGEHERDEQMHGDLLMRTTTGGDG